MKNMGSETPASATPMKVRSKNERGLSAEITPTATPDSSHSTAAPAASESVTGRREVSCGQTATWVLKE